MINFIDVFSGAGGLSEGFIRAGYNPLAHVEIDKDACDTLRTRSAYHFLKAHKKIDIYNNYLLNKIGREELWQSIPEHVLNSVINKEISKDSLSVIFKMIDDSLMGREVDLIIGGPPCQAYSIAGRARDPKGMKEDPRNYLYKYYVEFLKKYKPKMFVFENVPGILSANNGEFLNKIKGAVMEAGYDLKIPDKKFLNSKHFKVLQDRRRVIIIGWRKELKLEYPIFEEQEPSYMTGDSIFSDLPKILNGEGSLGPVQYTQPPTEYLKTTGIRNGVNFTTQHIARPHNQNDLEIYKIAVNKWIIENKRLNYSELPGRLIKHKNLKSFTDRFNVVNHLGISHTVVAHIAKDGHYYIHPDINQNRSISLREAARIQSFPDDYFFEGSRTSAFKQIGNAVPPLMAEGVANKIKEII